MRLRGADHTRFLSLNLLLDFWWGVRVELAPAGKQRSSSATRSSPGLAPPVETLRRPGWSPCSRACPRGRASPIRRRRSALFPQRRRHRKAAGGKPPPRGPHRRPFPYPIDWALHAGAAVQVHPRRRRIAHWLRRPHPPEKRACASCWPLPRGSRRWTELPAWRLELVGPVSCRPRRRRRSPTAAPSCHEFAAPASATDSLSFRPSSMPRKLASRYGALDVFC